VPASRIKRPHQEPGSPPGPRPRHQPINLGIHHYIGNNNQQWNAIMATAVIASIPATLLLIVAQRYVTAGAVKD
jgi:ABC-type glycerol-3-phosphate transport system permease component